MSAKTWLEEHYPVSAEKMTIFGTDKELVQHALRKWSGLLPEALTKHGLDLEGNIVFNSDEPVIRINGSTCALCIKYVFDADAFLACKECPLYKMLGHSCDEHYFKGKPSPFNSIYWIGLSDPQVIIDVLEKVLNTLE